MKSRSNSNFRNEFFAERLQLALVKTGIKQCELANHLGIDTTTVSFYTSGKREPSIDRLAAIARYLGVSTDYLLGNTTVVEVKRRHPVRKTE